MGIDIYMSNFGAVVLPEKPPSIMKDTGWPDRRYNAGKWYQEYMEFIERLAEFAYLHHGRLKKAPPFSAWMKHNKPWATS